jgi:hypothetical protein
MTLRRSSEEHYFYRNYRSQVMRFMIIVKATAASEVSVMSSDVLKSDMFAEMGAYHARLAKAGVLLDYAGLQASSKGWRIRYTGKKISERALVDGPFTNCSESRDLIAGYTLIQVRSRDEALVWSRRYPNPSLDGGHAEIEVRQLFEPEDLAQTETPSNSIAPF